MIPIRTSGQIEIMKEGGKRLGWVFGQVLAKVKPGIKLSELDQLAETLIKKQKGKPSFKMVKDYHWATCINVNQGVVHGIPGEYQLKNGDVVSLDMGMFYKGLHTDMARSIRMGSSEVNEFLETGKSVLGKAIKVARVGKRIGHISQMIESQIKKAGFSPVRALTGHGVGKKLHEEPQIPCFLKTEIKKTPLIKPGMSLAIEVIYTQGSPRLVLGEDNWTIETADGSLAGLFEDTVIVTKKKPLVLTFSGWTKGGEFGKIDR
ncbi:MAG TPA: type I methionyl aminopeptidase [Nevskiaceae bacterium]|nr:type I methionyl aminopeptidase [Nevskiaceae bacterium]